MPCILRRPDGSDAYRNALSPPRPWDDWRDRQATHRPVFEVRLRVRRDALEFVKDALGARRGVFYGVPTVSDEWAELEFGFSFFEEARREILALGGAVEVLSPEPLRLSIMDFAEQIQSRYPSARPASME